MSELLIRIFVGKNADLSNRHVREKCGIIGSAAGIFCNLLLCTVKIAVGLMFSAISIVADGLNNLSDMGSSVITMIGFKLSAKPADRDHPFGHGRLEYMSAFIVSMLIIFVGVELLISSVKTLIKNEGAPEYTLVAVVVLVLSVAVKFLMFLFNRSLGKKINSSALKATAQDSVNDAVTTCAILAATVVSMAVKVPFNLDAAMASLVALFIIWSGLSSGKTTLDEILGGPPDGETVEELERIVTAFDGFLGIHDLMVHDYGPGRRFASVHVEVPQNIDIVTCHEQIDLCEKLVEEKTGIELVIHMDPIDTDNESVAQTKNMMLERLKELDGRISLHDFRMTPAAKHKTNLIFDVVVPAGAKLSSEQLKSEIDRIAKEIDPSFCCVVKFDSNYTHL